MVRLLCALSTGSAALVIALPASAEPVRTLAGSLTALTPMQVTVKGEHTTLRCAVRAASPPVSGFATGDAVQVACARVRDALVLTRITHRSQPPAAAGVEPVRFGGAVTALSATSITLHDGDRNLTCALGASSPATASLHVGDHVRAVCIAGVLTSFELVTVPPVVVVPAPTPAPAPAPQPATVGYGLVSALSSTALTIHNAEHGDLTCSLTDHSPRVGDFRLGDRVRIGCSDGGVLVSIVRY